MLPTITIPTTRPAITMPTIAPVLTLDFAVVSDVGVLLLLTLVSAAAFSWSDPAELEASLGTVLAASSSGAVVVTLTRDFRALAELLSVAVSTSLWELEPVSLSVLLAADDVGLSTTSLVAVVASGSVASPELLLPVEAEVVLLLSLLLGLEVGSVSVVETSSTPSEVVSAASSTVVVDVSAVVLDVDAVPSRVSSLVPRVEDEVVPSVGALVSVSFKSVIIIHVRDRPSSELVYHLWPLESHECPSTSSFGTSSTLLNVSAEHGLAWKYCTDTEPLSFELKSTNIPVPESRTQLLDMANACADSKVEQSLSPKLSRRMYGALSNRPRTTSW
jgi:hypothetical protein